MHSKIEFKNCFYSPSYFYSYFNYIKYKGTNLSWTCVVFDPSDRNSIKNHHSSANVTTWSMDYYVSLYQNTTITFSNATLIFIVQKIAAVC